MFLNSEEDVESRMLSSEGGNFPEIPPKMIAEIADAAKVTNADFLKCGMSNTQLIHLLVYLLLLICDVCSVVVMPYPRFL